MSSQHPDFKWIEQLHFGNEEAYRILFDEYYQMLGVFAMKYVKDKLAAYPDIDPSLIFITHSGIAPEYIELVKNTIEEAMHFDEIHITKASCTISSHCGPNTLGILFETC